MTKLPVLTSRKVIRLLMDNGFAPDHQTGSHLILYHPVSKRLVVVPVHSRDIPKDTLKSILRSAGIEYR
ncbi:MAG: type II toxin-antitoxin system HicA family toxin [Planctomycetota bacterium]